MSVDLEYFKEFLDDPSAVSLSKFYDMVKAWGTYLKEHPELNYLTDDRWEEIRERLSEEFNKREDIRLDIEDEWDYLEEMLEETDSLSDEELLKLMRQKMTLMKTHQEFYEIPDEDIRRGEKVLNDYEESYQAQLIAQKNLRRSEFEVENSLAALDDKLAEISEKRGRPFHIHSFKNVKKHNGN